MIWRVSVGAALSMLDAVTDLYVISKYYSNAGLRGQANAMLAMIVTNMGVQMLLVLGQYKKKSLKVKVKEVLICLFFLRPGVDAYRMSTNHKDSEATVDSFMEWLFNKVRHCKEPSERKQFVLTHKVLPSDLRLFFVLSYRLPSLVPSRSPVACCKSSFC